MRLVELYFSYVSPYSQKVLIALYEKKLPFVGKLVNLADKADVAEYKAIFPLGKVPLLVTDHRQLVPESSIIIEYLDEVEPSRPLIPKDYEQARSVRLWDRLSDQYLSAPVINMLFESRKPAGQQNHANIERWSQQLGTMYRMIDDQLARYPYLASAEFSMADCAALPALHYSSQFASLKGFTRLSAYYESLMLRASAMRVMDDAAPYITAFLD
ncbi:Glutathione S-transferase [gamma proteobacterium HdN1]|nr:Glutathione S-transferase [gamma proteobacterium HdN1]